MVCCSARSAADVSARGVMQLNNHGSTQKLMLTTSMLSPSVIPIVGGRTIDTPPIARALVDDAPPTARPSLRMVRRRRRVT